jgi:hypothetical protein
LLSIFIYLDPEISTGRLILIVYIINYIKRTLKKTEMTIK